MRKKHSVFILFALVLTIAMTLASCDKHEHSYTEEVTEPTCTEGGYTTYTCECGESYVDDETDATGHNYVDGICSSCGTAEEDNNGDDNTGGDNTDDDNTGDGSGDDENDSGSSSHTHSYTAEVTAPTCDAGGYTTYTCECGESYVDDETDATGHNYVDGICENCGKDQVSSDGLKYTLSDDGTYYIVSGIGTCTDTDIIIPNTYLDFPVKEIGEEAFYDCDDIKNVEIPDSITSIGTSAFRICNALTSIEIPASVTSIGNSAFSGCSALKDVYIYDIASWCNISFRSSYSNPLSYADNLYLNGELVTDVVIPDGVTSIGNYAFANYDALVSIEIPASVTSIGSSAFSSCYKLVEVINKSSLNILAGSSDYGYVAYYALEVHSEESKIVNKDDYLFYTYEGVNYLIDYVGEDSELILPENYNGENYEIYKYAFYRRNDITSVEIPASVTSIGSCAFEYCSALESVSFGNNSQLQTIGDCAFYYCYALTGIEIPVSVNSIGSDAFSGCSDLIFNEYDNAYYLGNEENPYYALIKAKNTSITSFVINENTKVIAGGAFNKCRNLTSVSFGNNSQLQTIGDNAFNQCSALVSIEIPASVISIGSSAFYSCDALTSVSFGDNSQLQTIGEDAFDDCDALKDVYIYDIASWCNISFGNSPSNPLYYADNLYLNGELVTDVVIPDGVTSISSYAFYDCDALESVSFGDNSQLQTIGNYAFSFCSALTSVSFGDNSQLQTIGDCAFYYCYALTSVSFGDNSQLQTIGDGAFEYCRNLTSIELPASVTSIDSSAFKSCYALTSIEIPASVTSIGDYAFYRCFKLVEVINKSSLNITEGTYNYGWVAFYALEVHSGESKIVNKADYLFYTYEGVNYLLGYVGEDSELILPENYNGENYNIYKCAFYNLDDIISVEIPASVTGIGLDAFYYCSVLTSVSFGDNSQLQTIGERAFWGCSVLISIEIPASVTSIGYEAFCECYALESVKFSDITDWYVTTDSSYTGGTLIDVTDYSANAEYLNDTYVFYYWYKE